MLPPLDVSALAGLPQVNLEQYLGLWAIEETAFAAQWQMIQSMDLLAHVRAATPQSSATKSQQDNIAIIEIRGTMTKQGSSLSGAGSMVRVRQAVRAAVNNPDVEGIMFIIDSPGGTVSGTAELAEEIRGASAAKPTVTWAEDLMASAALWVGSQSRAVYANSDHATVGSKGVYMGLYDLSGMAAKDGIRPVVIRTGDLKGAGFPGTEISEAQKAVWQSICDAANESFDGGMANRKMSAESLKELSRGGVFSAKAATGMGLIDGIRSFDGARAELQSMIPKKKKGTAMSDSTNGAPSAASLADLKAACKDAGSDFLLSQLEIGATVATAQSAWMSVLAARNAELTSQIAKLSDEHKAALAAKDEKIAELTKKTTGSHKAISDVPLKGSKAASDAEGNANAKEQFEGKVAEHVKAGITKQKAIAKVVSENPELHKAYLDEMNGK